MKNILHRGFTLVEILVVLIIIGLVSSIIVIHRGSSHSNREIHLFARLLQSQMQVAREQSIVQMSVLGIRFTQKNYAFYRYHDKPHPTWNPLHETDHFWRLYTIPSNIQITVDLSNSQQAQIIFLPNGEITPFIITLKDQNTIKLIGTASGNISLEEVT